MYYKTLDVRKERQKGSEKLCGGSMCLNQATTVEILNNVFDHRLKDVSTTSSQHILKRQKCYPYQIKLTQNFEDDFDQCLPFCELESEQAFAKPQFLFNIVFSGIRSYFTSTYFIRYIRILKVWEIHQWNFNRICLKTQLTHSVFGSNSDFLVT